MTKRLASILTLLLVTSIAAAQPVFLSPEPDLPSMTAKSLGLSAARADKRIVRGTDEGRVASVRELLSSQGVRRDGIEPQAGTCSFTQTACN
ncbi:MAG: hypothetical protein ACSLFQ_08185 [Thermoanaerobaculia bacterium]